MSYDRSLFDQTLRQGLENWNLHLEEEIFTSMGDFAEMIVKANQSLNLTRLVEPEEMAIKNVLDSLSPLALEWPSTLACLDLGTGAGFPGIPLALTNPDWTIVLLDSLRKRLNFLDGVTEALALSNVSTLHARAEDAGRDGKLREQFDLVVSRAVASLPVLLELCTPFVKVGGCFIAFKASGADKELTLSMKAMKELNTKWEQTFSVELPKEMGERNLLVFRKMAKTAPCYPRRAGVPSKQPLE